MSAWANREITLTTNTSIHSTLTKSRFFIRTPHYNTPPWTTPDRIYSLLVVFTFPSPFQVFVHGVEKIIFISCQTLAVLSYVRQNSIKLSYTGMKLQNRPGTPKKKIKIVFLPSPPTAPKRWTDCNRRSAVDAKL